MVVPPKHPKMIIFSRKTHGFVGESHHLRKHPYPNFTNLWPTANSGYPSDSDCQWEPFKAVLKFSVFPRLWNAETWKTAGDLQLMKGVGMNAYKKEVYYSDWGACWGCYLSFRDFWLSWIGLETSFQLHPYLEPHQRHIIFLSSLSHHHSNRNLNLKTTLVFVNQKFTPTRIQQSGNTRRRRFMP